MIDLGGGSWQAILTLTVAPIRDTHSFRRLRRTAKGPWRGQTETRLFTPTDPVNKTRGVVDENRRAMTNARSRADEREDDLTLIALRQVTA